MIWTTQTVTFKISVMCGTANGSSVSVCLPTVVMAMSTVGFGDFFPVTILGRITVIISSIVGLWVFSLVQEIEF